LAIYNLSLSNLIYYNQTQFKNKHNISNLNKINLPVIDILLITKIVKGELNV